MGIATHLIGNNFPSVKQLQCFLAVAHELNFRRAADRLRMTQPPLTRQIKCLEAALEQQLFSRSTHKVNLTDAGRELVSKAEKILAELYALKSNTDLNHSRLRIGLTRTLHFSCIHPLGKQLSQLGVGDDIPDMTSAQLLQCLSRNTLDLVLTGEQGTGHEDRVQYKWLCREPLRLAMPARHPASLQETVSLKEVSDLPLFWFSRSANPTFYDKCERYFATLGGMLKRIKEPDDSLTMLTHIAGGNGFALLPQSKCTFHQEGLCYRKLPEHEAQQLNIDIYAATRLDEERLSVLNALDILKGG
ncbi:LysR family transcriptional regulator [Erwinia piriflorinigrans]|uniref:HTH-type transcriptional regulator benM Ben and cat operon transcriptional regulator n=1 Tax=Erwinia piriflorinigrans CFBP 5888 TaxID=1161919 RepID=V5ZBP2_9GAMM|nr:LysR family transcriptional regulator [Erwinia piriflorinigrans]CCG88680.1 HTH-type transcriptional regulator benM Ben and cat operon transcriptional regulator [Erwinia piriflorinigrans CFBP 5888]